MIIHWLICSFCLIFDICTDHKWQKYKLHATKIPDSFTNICIRVLFNQIFIAMPIFYFLCKFSDQPLFSWENLYKLPLTFLYEDIMFYYAHRLLHIPYLYEKVHKIHHRWTTPIAISAMYTHPFEQAFANILPVVLAARFAGLGKGAMRLWHVITLVNTLVAAHGGYKIPYYKNMHDKHHTDLNCNYGVLGILDRFHGTLR